MAFKKTLLTVNKLSYNSYKELNRRINEEINKVDYNKEKRSISCNQNRQQRNYLNFGKILFHENNICINRILK